MRDVPMSAAEVEAAIQKQRAKRRDKGLVLRPLPDCAACHHPCHANGVCRACVSAGSNGMEYCRCPAYEVEV